MNHLAGTLILSFALVFNGAQNLIGMRENDIRKYMAGEMPSMSIDGKVKNDVFRYLKYLSRDENETWVIFLDDKGKCIGVRVTCDNSILDYKVRELNEHFRIKDKGLWSYWSGGDEIGIRLQQYPWFFTITYEKTDHRTGSGNDRTVKEGKKD